MWVEEEAYCRYEREHCQRHLEESKVNMASRLNGAMCERGEERGESQRQGEQEPRVETKRDKEHRSQNGWVI